MSETVEEARKTLEIGIHWERERVLGIINNYQRHDELRLRAGEMTAQEMRTVQAVLAAIVRNIDIND